MSSSPSPATASYQQQEWAATFILFIFWALVGLIAAPFTQRHGATAYAHPSPVTQIGQGEAGPDHGMPHIGDTTHRRLVNLTRATQIGFLLLFTTTVVHGLEPAPSYTVGNSALTWISFAFLIVWYAATAFGFGDSVAYDLSMILPLAVLQIINFGLAFGAD